MFTSPKFKWNLASSTNFNLFHILASIQDSHDICVLNFINIIVGGAWYIRVFISGGGGDNSELGHKYMRWYEILTAFIVQVSNPKFDSSFKILQIWGSTKTNTKILKLFISQKVYQDTQHYINWYKERDKIRRGNCSFATYDRHRQMTKAHNYHLAVKFFNWRSEIVTTE